LDKLHPNQHKLARLEHQVLDLKNQREYLFSQRDRIEVQLQFLYNQLQKAEAKYQRLAEEAKK
jgi:hypothetical protein